MLIWISDDLVEVSGCTGDEADPVCWCDNYTGMGYFYVGY